MEIITLNSEKAKILTATAPPVDKEDLQYLQKNIADMLLKVKSIGAHGLAGPQVGVWKRIFVLKTGEVFINPEYIFRTGKATSHYEGCLSVPGERFTIKRFKRVKIKYRDREWKEKTLAPAIKMLNIVIQHEMDHLDGILVCDY